MTAQLVSYSINLNHTDMPNFAIRSEEEEIMDDFSIDDEGLHRTLEELEFINRWLGGNAITIGALKEVLAQCDTRQTVRIADLGCGSGDMLRLIHDAFADHYNLELVGIDANQAVVRHAKEKNGSKYPIQYHTMDILGESFRKETYDIVLCTLFLHHFPEKLLEDILRRLQPQTQKALIINDLHRHPLAYYSIALLTRLFSRSYMTRYDAKLSVLRAFSKKELAEVLQKSGWRLSSMHWRWAFRWKAIALPM